MNYYLKDIRLLNLFAATCVSAGFFGALKEANAQTVSGGQYAAPSASVATSTSTTGGTNINYQTNNSYNNEFGFAPGIFCRTPTLVLGAQSGLIAQQNVDDPWSVEYPENNSYAYNTNTNMNASIGFVMPIGSSVINDCKELVRQIAIDRKISSELSMIRACASLAKEGIKVDPLKYPLLSHCVSDGKAVEPYSSGGAEASNGGRILKTKI